MKEMALGMQVGPLGTVLSLDVGVVASPATCAITLDRAVSTS